MLKAIWRYFWPQDPEKTHASSPQLSLDLVTRAQFDAEIEEIKKRVEWDLSEWYDKFSTLHARAAKRVQRENKSNGVERVEQPAPEDRPLSILHMRRKPWSV